VARNLRDDLEDDFESVFLNTDEFAEQVIYIAIGKKPRPINAVVTITQSNLNDRTGHATKESGLEILCSTDPVTGIPAEQMGDVVKWNGHNWVYQRTVGSAGNSVTLHFTKVQITQSGHNRPATL